MKYFGKLKKTQPEARHPFHEDTAKLLGFPYRLLEDSLQPDEIMKIYTDELTCGRAEGYAPVLLPCDEYLYEYLSEVFADGFDVENCLREAAASGRDILAARLKSLTSPEDPDLESINIDEMAAETSGGGAYNVFSSIFEPITRKVLPGALVRLPTAEPWQATSYIPFGDWNDCPAPAEMTAICKYWYEKYGAVPAVITHDTLEFFLPEAVSASDAQDAAKELFAAAPDIVFQGSGMLGELADTLRKSRVWYLWWD